MSNESLRYSARNSNVATSEVQHMQPILFVPPQPVSSKIIPNPPMHADSTAALNFSTESTINGSKSDTKRSQMDSQTEKKYNSFRIQNLSTPYAKLLPPLKPCESGKGVTEKPLLSNSLAHVKSRAFENYKHTTPLVSCVRNSTQNSQDTSESPTMSSDLPIPINRSRDNLPSVSWDNTFQNFEAALKSSYEKQNMGDIYVKNARDTGNASDDEPSVIGFKIQNKEYVAKEEHSMTVEERFDLLKNNSKTFHKIKDVEIKNIDASARFHYAENLLNEHNDLDKKIKQEKFKIKKIFRQQAVSVDTITSVDEDLKTLIRNMRATYRNDDSLKGYLNYMELKNDKLNAILLLKLSILLRKKRALQALVSKK